ncbi:hypothetical protein ACIBIZ_21340 [Nonomuraea spiralis]|uniref:hypothetical protein n=1 Tax=Nonomuraea TaxID=83681 RepID=UPI000F7B98AC|nr:hypothetical protein [Nonomuraea sp. WAC 01424]RSN06470.1 hypothetical protein DMB42_24590 [Nonomuraea sp. WAC 01424]
MASQALAETVHTTATSATSAAPDDCAATNAGHARNAPCKWLEEGNKRCYYCRGKKGSGYKKQYCESKPKQQESTERECKTTKEPLPTAPDRTCKTCTDTKTGKVLSRECNS